ncbi:hypothetical protein RUND412_011300, partial [Rhizina undulata]
EWSEVADLFLQAQDGPGFHQLLARLTEEPDGDQVHDNSGGDHTEYLLEDPEVHKSYVEEPSDRSDAGIK